MAPYAMAHTKLEMVLRGTECIIGDSRLRIFLTNSLEEFGHDQGNAFANWLAVEAKAASFIKSNTPVMVVIGNPPYKGESENKGKWITDLIDNYKMEPGGGKLQESNTKWLNDDYVKFIRYGQDHIDRTGKGVLAYVNNHSYLDNTTFRGMRWSLLQSFDIIYILDLHGNSNKKEVHPDGSADKNVFDIKQGVAINLFIKTGQKKTGELAQVLHYDLYGTRQKKYQFLIEHDLNKIDFQELKPESPQYYFVPKNYRFQDEYDQGFSVDDLFLSNSVGIVTARDKFTINRTRQELKTKIAKFLSMSDEKARDEFSLRVDTRDWKVALAREDLESIFPKNKSDESKKRVIDINKAIPISYRPFDTQYTFYTGKSKGFHCMPRGEVMQHLHVYDDDSIGKNVGLTLCRQVKAFESYQHVFITSYIFESSLVSNKTSEISSGFPLYLYPDEKQQHIESARMPNLEPTTVQSLAKGLGLEYVPEKQSGNSSFAPIDLLDYIYAVLHSPSYRERYKELLKSNFPKVPYPTDKGLFWKLVKLGGELRSLHLMNSHALEKLITSYTVEGSNLVEKLEFKIENNNDATGNLYINDDKQFFGNLPKVAWEFYIGGYQPAQKWLKDRKGSILTVDDRKHYQKIIVALKMTADIMPQIDNLIAIDKN